MLDKKETLKQTRRNSVGLCETKTDRYFDKDYNNTNSRVLGFNPLKIQQGGPYSPHQQLLHYLQQTHYQQLQGHRYHSSPPPPPVLPTHRFQSQCCREPNAQTSLPFVFKSELRSGEKRGYLSPSPKECKEEKEDSEGEERGGQCDYAAEEERRMLLEERLLIGPPHPNGNLTGLKRPHGDCKQHTYYHPSNHREQQEQDQEYNDNNTEKKMDNEDDVDIKVDDIDVDFIEHKDMKCKFNNFNDSNSSLNGRRSCSVSISSNSSSSTSGSVCSGDEDDADSGIDGGHHKNNNRDSNSRSIETTELRIIDITPTKTYTDTGNLKDIDCSSKYKNTKVKNHDTDYQQQNSPNDNDNKMRESFTGECAYYQNRCTPDSPRGQGKDLSAIFTHEDAHNNPPDLTRKFTNFFIDDILKPEFGKKPFETGTTTIPTLTPVVRRFKSFPSSSSSFPFSISSLSSQSSLLSPSSSPSSVASQNSGVSSSSGKKKGFSRYGSDPRRCSPSKSSASLTSPSAAPLNSSSSSRTLHTKSDKRRSLSPTSSQKDLTTGTPVDPKTSESLQDSEEFQFKYPAWVFCTRYSDRPSSGPRSRKMKRKDKKTDEKRPRTAFTPEQLQRLKREFDHGRYLTEERRQALAKELGLNESQIKIWFQNKRAKMKKVSGNKNPLALQLIAEGLYNHQTNKDQPLTTLN